MTKNKIKIAIFKPYNARTTNAFYGSQHQIFKYLQENYNYQITYFIDDKSVRFDKIDIKYIEKDRVKTFILIVARKIFGRFKHYWKIPYYKKRNLNFSKYDVIITEGIHYLLLDYFKYIADKVIINDSISYNYTLDNAQIRYLNKYFNKSLAVVVNDKITILYKENDLNLNTITIGHAVDVNLISFIKKKEFRGKILSVGRIVPEKGFEYIIEAVGMLKNRYPDIRLDIYGVGILEDHLRGLIKSLNLEKIISLKGFLEYKKLLKKMGDYDLFISHPIAAKDWEEYFGMANLEAMASGLPVISSNCGAVPWVLKDKAVIVEQKNINQIVEAVENFIESPSKVERYSVKGRKYIEENYSIEIIAKKWNEAIKRFTKGD